MICGAYMPTRHAFHDAVRPLPVERTSDGGRFSFVVDESWYQGRGAFGGVAAAALLEAMTAVVDDERRRPRSLTVHFCAPLEAGKHAIVAHVERFGARVTHLGARVLTDGKVACLASATFAATRDATLSFHDAKAPLVPPFDTVPPVGKSPLLPAFCQHFEYRFCVGHLPYGGADEARTGGWIRPRSHERLDYTLATALLDAYPPAVLARAGSLTPAASVDLTVDFFEPLPLERGHKDGRALVDARSRFCGGGYADELAELWSEDGRLLAQARQLVALL
jgi:acyl-CoA thioesterase